MGPSLLLPSPPWPSALALAKVEPAEGAGWCGVWPRR